MSNEKEKLRARVVGDLDAIILTLNAALRGEGLNELEDVITRISRGGQLPHWYQELKKKGTIANLDGKTIGSILEMLLVAVIEKSTLADTKMRLRVNPARGVDLPDLDLGVKSPSTNFCTSEPFFSAYERLYGNEHDCLILLTDYQDAKKKKENFKLQVQSWCYMKGSQVADQELCRVARQCREKLLSEDESGSTAKRVFRFLAYVNQADWVAKWLLILLDNMSAELSDFDALKEKATKDFEKQNKERSKKDRELIPDIDLISILKIFEVTPRHVGIINQLDNWVTESLKDASRAPNDNEWKRLLESPLDGRIGMSFALQWRYNFGRLFGKKSGEKAALNP